MSITTNGRLPRKQLADQLDRFDSILDGLSDALNEAVADAAREGARSAVKEILTEIMTNPQFASVLQPAPAAKPYPVPAPVAKPSIWSKLRSGCKKLITHVKARAQAIVSTIRQKITSVRATVHETIKPVATVLDLLRFTGSLKQSLWIASGVGLVVGAVSAICPHWLAATVSAIAGTVTAFSVQLGLAVKNFIAKFRLN